MSEEIKFRRKYYHVGGFYDPREKAFICDGCGKKLTDTLTDFPCTNGVSNIAVFDNGISVEISVWNCRADVCVYIPSKDGTRRKHLDIKKLATKEEQEKIDELAYKSVEDSGGAINWSGLYPANDELVELIGKILKREKLL
jgi:hypothetical protein